MTKRWSIELLGGLRLGYGEQRVEPVPYQKAVALLAYLAYFTHYPHPRAALIEVLWPEVEPAAGQRNLRVALHTLRRLLEVWHPAVSDLVAARRATIQLDPTAFTTDAAEFRAALQEATRHAALRPRAEALGAAVAIYGGELLPGFFESWVLTEREHLAASYLEALHQLVRVREELGDLTGALAAARQAVAVDPLREETHFDVMRLYAATGQPSACLRQYQELERRLREELGETPSAETRALAEELERSARRLVVARRPLLGRQPDEPGPDRDRNSPDATRPSPGRGRAFDVAGSGPPPTDLAVSGAPLPLSLNHFFGREAEIAQLVQRLLPRDLGFAQPAGAGNREEEPAAFSCPARLVTITGPGGSGKTRLAIAVAGRMQESFGDAITFVPLADVTDSQRLDETVAEALGLERAPATEPWSAVVEHLRGRPWLLVLDNFEQLVETGATQVRALLERAGALTCLITSRQRLGVSGEQEHALLPLPTPRVSGVGGRGSGVGYESLSPTPDPRPPTPDAVSQYPSVQLFVDRARAARADFRLTAENAPAVAELCDRLEGLPLAIELAAGRAAVLSPEQMLEQLAARFEFLVSRQRDLPARHRTLRAAIDTSFEALSPPLRQFFTRLSVFRGGWTLPAAQAVCSDFALDFLQQLRECSLVIAEETAGEVRYRLLETLREYSAAGLSGAERTALLDRHLAFFLEMAERLHHAPGPSSDLGGGEWLSREYPNLQVALEWSLTSEARAELGLRLASRLDALWNRRTIDGRKWLAAFLERAPRAPIPLRATALRLAGRLAGRQNQLPAAGAAFGEALALWRQTEDRDQVADTLIDLALWARGRDDLPGAQAYLEECVALRQAGGDREGAAWALENLAWVVAARGGTGDAIALLQESLATGRSCGALELVAYALHGLGWLSAYEGDLPSAARLLDDSLQAARELARQPVRIGHRSGIKRDWSRMNPDQARGLLERSLTFNRILGHHWIVMHNLGALGHIARQQGDSAGARGYYQASLRLRRELDDLFAVAQALEDLAALDAEQYREPAPAPVAETSERLRDSRRATRLLGAAEALCETLGVRPPVAVAASYHQTVAALRGALGEEAFASAWAEGRATSMEAAVRYALEESGDEPPGALRIRSRGR